MTKKMNFKNCYLLVTILRNIAIPQLSHSAAKIVAFTLRWQTGFLRDLQLIK